jgi:hypothetical protein
MATKIEENPILRYQAQQAQMQNANTLRTLEMKKTLDEQTDLTAKKVSAVVNKAASDEVIQTALSGFEAKTTADNELISNILGLNPDNANFRLEKLVREREDAYEKTKITSAEIAKKQSLNILNDPLAFISAQFTLPSDIATHNYYVDRYEASAGEFNNIVQAGTATATANKALKATTSAAMAEAQLKSLQESANIALTETKQQGLSLHIAGIKNLQDMDEASLRIAAQAVNIDETIKNNAARRAQMALTMEQTEAVRAERLAKAKTIEAVKAEEDHLVNSYNTAAKANGSPALPASIILSKFRRGDEDSKVIGRMISQGEAIILNGDKGKTGVVIAPTPAEAAKLHMSINSRPVGTDANTVAFLAQAYKRAFVNPVIAGQKDVTAQNMAASEFISNLALSDMKGIKKDTPNLYAAPPVQALLEAAPPLRNYEFINKTLAEIAAANPSAPLKDEDIISAASTAINKDPKRMNEIAKAVSLYYSAAINYNNSALGLAENALPLQKGYNAVLDTGFLGREQTIDLSKEIDVRTLMMNKLIRSGPLPGFSFGL